jgi:hypothetical protein
MYLSVLSCFAGAENPSPLRKGKADTPLTLRTLNELFPIPYFRTMALSFVSHVTTVHTQDFIWPLDATPAPRTPKTTPIVASSAPAFPALPTFLGCTPLPDLFPLSN